MARLLAVALMAGSTIVMAAAPPKAEIERGRQLYMATGCYQCHGTVGQGSRFTGPALVVPGLWPLEAFAAQLRSPADAMPPYTAKVMADEDIAAIRSYLASLPPPPDPNSIALLQAVATKK
jgi:ubiquinol-cytochrome c reductase cytochrome c subunit